MSKATFSHHEPCPECGSKDNLAVYKNGRKKCFGANCEYFSLPDNDIDNFQPAQTPSKPSNLMGGLAVEPLPHRVLSADSCGKYGYKVGSEFGSRVEVANYHDASGKVVAQKIRRDGKKFSWRGDASKVTLYGQHLWKPGKRLTICEGEIDTISVAQISGCKWPVVGIPNGAASAKEAILKNLEWVEQFETVILCFDGDDAGREGASQAASVISPGKCHIAHIPDVYNDPNGMLVSGKVEELNSILWSAPRHQPQEIKNGADLWDMISEKIAESPMRYPYASLNNVLHGIRSELICVCAGSGMGKSLFTKEIAYGLVDQGFNIGIISLEESLRRSALGLVGLAINQPVHLPHIHDTVSQELLDEGFKKTLGTGRVHFLEHFGSLNPDELLPKMKYLAKALNCKAIFLDHVSMLASGSEAQDERKFIDSLMTRLRTMVQELDIALICVSHLSRSKGSSAEDGGRISLSSLRGSHSIAQLSDIVLAMERDPHDPEHADTSKIRILKNRFTGELGVISYLDYDRDTGRLIEGVDEL